MKILVLADIHGETERLAAVLAGAAQTTFDVVLCPGDFTDMFNTTPEFSQTDTADILLQKILTLKKPTLCVPGNHDPYEIVGLFKQYGANLHKKTKEIKNTVFIGFGGAATPFNTIFEPTEEETKENLNALGEKTKKNFVLMVHNPPKNTKLDRTLSGGHVGSQAVREFIQKKEPILAISAHIHEARGTDQLGPTALFYPGAVFEGYYGIAEITGGGVKCETRQVQ